MPLPPRDDERDLSFIWHQSREDYRAGHREIGVTLHGTPERIYVQAWDPGYDGEHAFLQNQGYAPRHWVAAKSIGWLIRHRCARPG